MNKYKAKKVIVTEDGTIFEADLVEKYSLDIVGILFDSAMEGEYYQELLLLKKEGIVKEIECHPKFILQEKPKITYIADFRVTFMDGQQVVVDVKGVETSTFRVKARMFAAVYPDAVFRIIKKHRGQWVPIAEVKKEKSERKRAFNKMVKQAERKGR